MKFLPDRIALELIEFVQSRSRNFPVLVSLAFALILATPVSGQDTEKITIRQIADRVEVRIGDELFTEYIITGHPRPILYPVYAVGQQSVVRHFPMKADVSGEAADHPHHRSVWFAHGDVNGLDYWSGKATIRHRQFEEFLADGLQSTNDWMDGEKPVCSDRTTIRFQATDNWRLIDYQVAILADDEPVVLGDTKEGAFAIRTHPRLRIKAQNGETMATAFNSEGVQAADVWGKSARWIHYQNTIGGKSFAVSVLDHPDNFRHPTLWHARDYGLIAANPFGQHQLGGRPAGSGVFTIAPHQSLTLRYGIVVWSGESDRDDIESVFEIFAGR